MTAPSTEKIVTKKEMKKLATTTAEKKIIIRRRPLPPLLGGSIRPPPRAYFETILVQRYWIGRVHVLIMPRLHRSQAPMAGQRWEDIGGAGRDNEGYGDVLDLNGCYFVYICVRDPGRARELEARK